MRAHVRHGYSNIQGRINMARWSKMLTDERGCVYALEPQDRFAALNDAAWHRLYRLTVLRDHLSPHERLDHLRCWRLRLDKARRCKRPRLPT